MFWLINSILHSLPPSLIQTWLQPVKIIHYMYIEYFLTTLNYWVLHCGYMSSNSRWFLDTQHSSSFKGTQNFVLYTIYGYIEYLYVQITLTWNESNLFCSTNMNNTALTVSQQSLLSSICFINHFNYSSQKYL